jgi:hypothetical protein
VSGTVNNSAGTFTATSDTMLAKVLPAGLTAGAYTVRFPPPSNAALPRGHGYAIVKLTKTCVVSLAGKLGDGTPFTGSAPLQVNSNAQVFIPLYVAPKGSLFGTLSFRSQTASDVDGTLTWNKPAPARPGTQLYPGGFNTMVSAQGAVYPVPAKGAHVLTHVDPANATADVTFADGDQATFTRTVHLSIVDKVTSVEGLAAGEKFTLTIARTTGLFSGSFQHAGAKKPTPFNGVLLQKSTVNHGDGVFLGTTESGGIDLVPK